MTFVVAILSLVPLSNISLNVVNHLAQPSLLNFKKKTVSTKKRQSTRTDKFKRRISAVSVNWMTVMRLNTRWVPGMTLPKDQDRLMSMMKMSALREQSPQMKAWCTQEARNLLVQSQNLKNYSYHQPATARKVNTVWLSHNLSSLTLGIKWDPRRLESRR